MNKQEDWEGVCQDCGCDVRTGQTLCKQCKKEREERK